MKDSHAPHYKMPFFMSINFLFVSKSIWSDVGIVTPIFCFLFSEYVVFILHFQLLSIFLSDASPVDTVRLDLFLHPI